MLDETVYITKDQVNSIVAGVHRLPDRVKIDLRRAIAKNYDDLTAMTRIELAAVIAGAIPFWRSLTTLQKNKILFGSAIAVLGESKNETRTCESLIADRCKDEQADGMHTVTSRAAALLEANTENWKTFRIYLLNLIKMVTNNTVGIAAPSLMYDLLHWDGDKNLPEQWLKNDENNMFSNRFVKNRWEETIVSGITIKNS